MPGSSALIVAPCTGVIEPTALRLGAQSAFFTFALVTVVGGWAKDFPAEIMEKIWKPLIPAISRKMAMRPRTTLKMAPFWLRFRVGAAVRATV